ncbi:hypothetical protein GA0115259_104145 [Streptomyces sp. MnatMP-M17]|nr:hypothetical protein GA0115259_104145 [Streptomyces sp. MnatMP-M17]
MNLSFVAMYRLTALDLTGLMTQIMRIAQGTGPKAAWTL